jgi:aldose 1-epimerase
VGKADSYKIFLARPIPLTEWLLVSGKPIILLIAVLYFPSCRKSPPQSIVVKSIQTQTYGTTTDGKEVKLFTIYNPNGLIAKFSEYGATLVSLEVPDRDGKIADVTLGYDTHEQWLVNTSYFGSSVGRYANRIAGGKFSLDGKDYQLATNNTPGGMPCHLHGGKTGFDKALWKGEVIGDSVVFRYRSVDGEEGYPGNLDVTVTYSLTDSNELIWEATATTDAPTIINLVHHSYWNLSGDPQRSILNHELQLEAKHYLPTNVGMIPTGEIADVSGTPMDFTHATAIGQRIDADFEALRFAGGYDHCWVLNPGTGTRLAARLSDPTSGRTMEVFTNQPGIQFYSGNFLDGTAIGKSGITYGHRSGLCLETQNFPDAPNHPAFPSAVLRPGETYRHRMIHRFSTKPN